ncbi:hypothetical protein ACFYWN_37475 [Streptomyces sp. NPDC002917]|uniref:hypothetical protein n=1 Tax=Streptomyces sp. NPDC002917 TaxID=3364671 RepID=UPI00367D6C5E
MTASPPADGIVPEIGDVGDVLRIMMTARPRQLAKRFAELRKDTRIGDIAVQGSKSSTPSLAARPHPASTWLFAP